VAGFDLNYVIIMLLNIRKHNDDDVIKLYDKSLVFTRFQEEKIKIKLYKME